MSHRDMQGRQRSKPDVSSGAMSFARFIAPNPDTSAEVAPGPSTSMLNGAYTRPTRVFRLGARLSHPMAALSLLAIGLAITRRDALPWGTSDALQKLKTRVGRV